MRAEARGQFLRDLGQFLQFHRGDHPGLRRAIARERRRDVGEQAMLVGHEGAPPASVDLPPLFQGGPNLRRFLGLGGEPPDRSGRIVVVRGTRRTPADPGRACRSASQSLPARPKGRRQARPTSPRRRSGTRPGHRAARRRPPRFRRVPSRRAANPPSHRSAASTGRRAGRTCCDSWRRPTTPARRRPTGRPACRNSTP